jgi:hypothetical protein
MLDLFRRLEKEPDAFRGNIWHSLNDKFCKF